MNRGLSRSAVLSYALACALLLSCATEPRRADEPAKAVDDDSVPRAGASEPNEATSRQMLERARAREARRGERAWRCLVENACEDHADRQPPEASQDLELALEVLRQKVPHEGDRLAFRTAARLALEEAVTGSERARAALEDGFVLHHGAEMPYSLADLPSALASADAKDRLPLLASSVPVLDARAALELEAAGARGHVAARAQRTAAGLIALRAGVDAAELRLLVDDVLTRTAPLLPRLQNGPADVPALLARHETELDATSWRRGPLVHAFGGRRAGAPSAVPQCVVVDPPRDVRLLEGAQSPPSLGRYARACASAASRLTTGPWDPAWLHVVASLFRDTAWLSSHAAKNADARGRHRTVYVLEARRLAVEVRASLDDTAATSRDGLDSLGTSWASPEATSTPGASALLALDASGAAADALVAVVVTAAVDAVLTARHGPGWAGDPNAAAAVEAELDNLGSVWHDDGPRGVLRALGITTIDAAPIVARARRR